MARIVTVLILFTLATVVAGASAQTSRTKKIVFIAGKKSHGPGFHEYEKGARLLARYLETSPNLHGYGSEVHLYGWPEDPKTLDDADCIVVYCDGSDHNEADHPLLTGDRLAVLARQMKRGCGLVALHYTVFVPGMRGGPEFLDWLGGYFDYETGTAPNHWYSKIKNASTTPEPATPTHPICLGLTPFPLTEEYYYNIRFRPNDPRFTPILNTTIPDEPRTQTVAWAVQRADGGRGFAYTGGHFHKNWQVENLRKMVLNAIVWAARGEVPAGGVQSTFPSDQDDIRALILTGYHMPAHDWRATTAALQEILPRDPRIKVTVWEDPEKLATEDLSRYDLIIQNFNNWDHPTLSQRSRDKLLAFVRSGGGLIPIHFANGAWLDWPDYRRLCRRVWIEGKSSHDAYGPFRVEVHHPESPVTAGIADFDTTDELYCRQQGVDPVDPLLTAHSKVTGQDEPLAFCYTEGKGRIFQCLLGHDVSALKTPALAEILRRACAWAANREVLSNAVPVAAPIADPAAILQYLRRRHPTGSGRFGDGLFPSGSIYAAKGRDEYQEPPLTVECSVKLFSKNAYNILVANSSKDSPRHWEMYTEAGSGTFAVLLPGLSPSVIDSKTAIADGNWHHVGMVYLPARVKLFVDGVNVLDQPVSRAHATSLIGPLWFGSYPPQGLGCDGLIDEVRISDIERDLSHVPNAPFTADSDTIGLWHFDSRDDNGAFADSAKLANAVTEANAKIIESAAPTQSFAPWPTNVNVANSVDWSNVGNDKGAMRYSPLKQIDRSNVGDLKVAWTYHTGDAASAGSTIECTPIVVEGVMYVTTVKVKVVALDAATGREIWEYDPHTSGVNRGVGYWSDGKPKGERRILLATGDGRLVSLDARTGKLDPKFGSFGTVDLRAGIERDITHMAYGSTCPPAVFENLCYVGFIVSEGMPGAPGDIRAFNVRTGKEVWRFRTVPQPYEFGAETWEGNGWKERSGVNAWDGYTLDAKRGILFAGLGSASSDFYGSDRPGANLFANCTLALDARTGKRLWHFQETHHDLWDHDNACPPTLCTIVRNGKPVDAVAQVTKTGFCFLFDRVTGDPMYPIREVPAPPSDIPGEVAFPTQPEPTLPPPLSRTIYTDADITDISSDAHAEIAERLKHLRYGKQYLPPSLEGTVVAPGYHGGSNWSGASFDPTNGLLYVNTNDCPSIEKLNPNGRGGYDFAGYAWFNDRNGYPAMKPPWGWLTAVNVSNGSFAWRVPFGEYPVLTAKGVSQTGTQNFGGTIVTAGGLVFTGGTMDEKFHAFDKTTGKLLWDYHLPAGGYATPCTYSVNGRQYVVIAAGGGGKLATTSGDTFVAFALRVSGRSAARR